MKHILSLITASFLASHAALAAADRPLLVSVPVRNVFIPAGFDDNDNVQVVLEGAFTDTCYRLAHTEVLKSGNDQEFEIVQWARKFPGICIPTTVPFKSEVSLGRLVSGTYKIEAVGVSAASLEVIRAAANSQDDYIYAPVSAASVGRRNTGHYVATLTGTLPNGCFTVDRTEVLRQEKVLVVLPVIKYDDSGECRSEPQPFEVAVNLPTDLTAGKYLLHVRSMSGKATNVVFFADGD
jgi:hypothetical protein